MNNKIYKTKEEIEDWLNLHEIENYELVADKKYGFIVNVFGDVNLRYNKYNPFYDNLEFVPIKFNIITGDLDCSFNDLKNMDFLPNQINGKFVFLKENNNLIKKNGIA